MTEDALNFLPAIPGPQRPADKIGLIRGWILRETVNTAVLAHPVANFHMIGVGVLSVSSSLGLVGGKEALLCPSDLVQMPGNFSV